MQIKATFECLNQSFLWTRVFTLCYGQYKVPPIHRTVTSFLLCSRIMRLLLRLCINGLGLEIGLESDILISMYNMLWDTTKYFRWIYPVVIRTICIYIHVLIKSCIWFRLQHFRRGWRIWCIRRKDPVRYVTKITYRWLTTRKSSSSKRRLWNP